MNDHRPTITSLPRISESKAQERQRHRIAANAVLDAMSQSGRTRLMDEDSLDQEQIEAILERVASRGQQRGLLSAMAKDLGVPANEPGE